MMRYCDRFILNDQGEPVPEPDLDKWAAWLETHPARQVADDYDEGDAGKRIRISTRFMGIDLRLIPIEGEPPLLWKTMVFGGPLHLAQERYTTLAAAVAGHQAMCQRVQAMLHQ